VVDTIIKVAIIAAGSALVGYAVMGRLISLHRPMTWQGGGRVTLIGELSIGIFALSIGFDGHDHHSKVSASARSSIV
jgi:hypothetical protein